MHRLFVFGTLKRGFPLHERARAGAIWLGRGTTIEAYPMFVAGRWYAPMMLNEPGHGYRVMGELYEIEGPRLELNDGIESVGVPGNFRTPAWIEPSDGGAARRALIYMKDRALALPIHTGRLADYQDRRFVPPEHRGT